MANVDANRPPANQLALVNGKAVEQPGAAGAY